MYPLLVCDLWEHAYYLDHQNKRRAFLEGFFSQLANWEFAAKRFETHQQQGSTPTRQLGGTPTYTAGDAR